MLSCQRCKQTTNGPQAFLLACRGCNKSWHHRCHMPPVEDAELMQRIRATNLGDTDNDLSSWKCRRCKRGVSSTPSVASSREPTVSSESHDDRTSTAPSFSPAVPDAALPASVSEAADVRVRQEQESERDRTRSTVPPSTAPQSAVTDARPGSNREQEPIDDDPEDLYGPPVERRVIRILPSLAEELREQRRRAAAEMERRRVPLAPDWISARHAHDPLWKEIRPTTDARRRRKPTARRLGDSGLNVSELVGYLTLQNSLREHKA